MKMYGYVTKQKKAIIASVNLPTARLDLKKVILASHPELALTIDDYIDRHYDYVELEYTEVP